MPALNYTTTIAVERTVAEIQVMLGKHGASAVAVRYAASVPVGVSFTMDGIHGPAVYTLPVDAAAMEKLLAQQWRRREIQRRYSSPDQAARVAWRVIKDWLAAQLALVDAQMVSLQTIMLPFMHEGGPETPTIYDRFLESGVKAIEPERG